MIETLNGMGASWWGWMGPMLWQVALLALVVWLVDLVLRRRGWPQVRYALWLLVLLKLVLPPTLTLPTSFTARIPALVEKTVRVQLTQPPAATPPAQAPPLVVPTEGPKVRSGGLCKIGTIAEGDSNDISLKPPLLFCKKHSLSGVCTAGVSPAQRILPAPGKTRINTRIPPKTAIYRLNPRRIFAIMEILTIYTN